MSFKEIWTWFIAAIILFSCKPPTPIEPIPSEGEVASFKIKVQNIYSPETFYSVGTFDSIAPFRDTSFEVMAPYGSKLFFMTKLASSNDVFFATDVTGIPLYFNGRPISGKDVTNTVKLWDGGLYLNSDRSKKTPDNPKTLRILGTVRDSLVYPAIKDAISVTVDSIGDMKFRVTVKNLGANAILTGNNKIPFTLSPGFFTVSVSNPPMFYENFNASPGFKYFIDSLNSTLLLQTWKIQKDFPVYMDSLPTGIYAVHNAKANPFFTQGQSDTLYNSGLYDLVVNNNPNFLLKHIGSAVGISSQDSLKALKARKQDVIDSYEFTITARKGDHFSFVSKVKNSSDNFFALADNGIPLWNPQGGKLTGDISGFIKIYDLGKLANTVGGKADPFVANTVVPVASSPTFPWIPANYMIRITVTPL